MDTRKKFCCFYGVNPSLVEMGKIFESPGNISYIIQSGGIAVLVMESLYYDLVGVNKVVSIGNKCDVDEADLIDYFQNDETEVICMYLEKAIGLLYLQIPAPSAALARTCWWKRVCRLYAYPRRHRKS